MRWKGLASSLLRDGFGVEDVFVLLRDDFPDLGLDDLQALVAAHREAGTLREVSRASGQLGRSVRK